VWIVTVDTEKVGFLTVPVARPLAMDSVTPVSELRAVTLPAQKVGVLEIDQLTVAEREEIVPLFRVMTVEAPHTYSPMFELNVSMNEQGFTPLEIYREVLFRTVTGATGGNSLGQGLEWDGKFQLALLV
jgi:hypothetical protein